MYIPTPPPVRPPKPSSHETSRLGTPALGQSPHSPQLPEAGQLGIDGKGKAVATESSGEMPGQFPIEFFRPLPDPGEHWLPNFVESKSKHDLAEILSKPELLNALTQAQSTIHSSLISSDESLQTALDENVRLASHLGEVESRLSHQRSSTQGQLLSTHALERQWRQKQSEMDHALAPFSPSSLYQRLSQALQEQEMICEAMEESFLEGTGALASERETSEWVRKYRDAKKLHYLRQERKERWDEGRVGGWR